MRARELAEIFCITIAAFATSMLIFGLFMLSNGASPWELCYWSFRGGFGTWFSWQNSLTRAAPLMLTALCTALPARLGVIIVGGEGALVAGGLTAAMLGLALPVDAPLDAQISMALGGMLAGGICIAAIGALHTWRGVNATLSSLLLTYIAIGVFNYLVEGPLRDPASSNKPSTRPIPHEFLLGSMFGADIHWGLGFGVLFCVLGYVLMKHTTFGFAASMIGGNVKAAQGAGLPIGLLMLITCFLGGSAAGLAGMIEVAAVHGQANASLITGYGFTGVLVAFISRHSALAIIPVAILFGGLSASAGVVQRHLHVPNASVQVLMGILFVTILLFDTWYGRFRVFQPRALEETS